MIYSIIARNMVNGYGLGYGDESYRNANPRSQTNSPRVWLLPYDNTPNLTDAGQITSLYSLQFYVERLHPQGIDIYTSELLGERQDMETDAMQLVSNIFSDEAVSNVSSVTISSIPANDTDHAFNGVLVSLTVELFQEVVCPSTVPVPPLDAFTYTFPVTLA